MRLLICHDCRTIEELPDYEGPLERGLVPMPDGNLGEAMVPPVGADVLLDTLVAPHQKKEHSGQLVSIDDKDWADPKRREEILKRIRESVTTGLEPEAYALRNTFQEDALKCYSAHNRPKDGCIDWHDRSKRLGNSLLTDDERREAKSLGLKRIHQRFLCDFCPVASNYVQRKKWEKDGLYN